MHPALRREIGLAGAIITGLGSILGTGAFIAIGLASGMWGDNVLVAVPAAQQEVPGHRDADDGKSEEHAPHPHRLPFRRRGCN